MAEKVKDAIFMPSNWCILFVIYMHRFNGPFSGTTQVSCYQKGKTNLDFTEARDNDWQWHQLDHMQVCISLQTDNHTRTPPLKFFTGRMPSLPAARPTASKHWRHTVCYMLISIFLTYFLNCLQVFWAGPWQASYGSWTTRTSIPGWVSKSLSLLPSLCCRYFVCFISLWLCLWNLH